MKNNNSKMSLKQIRIKTRGKINNEESQYLLITKTSFFFILN